MTKFKVGDKVEVFQDGSTFPAWVGVKGIVKEVLPYYGYRVELTDVAKTSEKVGYRARLGGSNLKLIEERAFKVGDRVEFIEHYMDGATTGTKATVVGICGEFTDVETDDGKSFSPYARRLKLIEEPALTLDGFTVGDKVRYTGYLWKNLEGVVSSINGNLLDIRVTKLHDNVSSYTSLKVGKTLVETCGGKGIDTHSLVKIEETKPFTFKDIQVGDTIRRTRTYKSGAKEVREGTVSKVGNDYVAEGGNTFILAYGSDTTSETVTLELLNRPEPEPEPVKEAWETAKAGDRLVVKNDEGCTRVLTKRENGDWDTLLIRPSGNSSNGFIRTDASVKVQLTQKNFSVGKPQFVRA